ncbi:HD domain-containing protein [Amphibacillus sp. Q70]|uniref:HD domain-containing protein n=1 Tax=Amphibacillus sp. Q70 TaxID=3453416 RepID=UPI003F848F4E
MITNQIMRAITYATTKHDGQRRKVDQTPYIAHPYRVAMLLKDHHCDNDVVIAGLLHDIVEDTEGTLEEIDVLFGKKVSILVGSVTEKEKSLPWEERKQQSINKISEASLNVKLITCADKIDNLHSMLDNEVVYGSSMWHAFDRGKSDQQWYYKNMYQSVITGIDPKAFHPLMYLFKSLLDSFLQE